MPRSSLRGHCKISNDATTKSHTPHSAMNIVLLDKRRQNVHQVSSDIVHGLNSFLRSFLRPQAEFLIVSHRLQPPLPETPSLLRSFSLRLLRVSRPQISSCFTIRCFENPVSRNLKPLFSSWHFEVQHRIASLKSVAEAFQSPRYRYTTNIGDNELSINCSLIDVILLDTFTMLRRPFGHAAMPVVRDFQIRPQAAKVWKSSP